MNQPRGLFVDGSGNVFIADTGNDCVREVNASTGTVNVVFGNQTDGAATGGSTALNATLLGPTAVFVDAAGDIFASDTVGIHELVAATGNVVFLAGNANEGYNGDSIPATRATLGVPEGVAVDGNGDIFIADTFNDRIREVQLSNGQITTVAGDGTAPTVNTGASVEPWGITVGGPSQPLYFTQHHVTDIYPPATGSSGIEGIFSVSPLGGTVSFTSGPWATPSGLFIDSSGNTIVAATTSSQIDEVSASGSAQVIAGLGFNSDGLSNLGDGGLATDADLVQPRGLFEDGTGNVFIADTGNSRIRQVVSSTGDIQTVAGEGSISGSTSSPLAWGFYGDGGPAVNAGLYDPEGVVVDGSGNIFIADTYNNRVREVFAATGIIQTVAGTGVPGFSGDGGPATAAELNRPTGLAFDLQGNLLIVDSYNSRIRKLVAPVAGVTADLGGLLFNGIPPGTTSGALEVTLTNSGTVTVTITAAPSISGMNSSDFAVASGTTCTAGAVLTPNANCTVSLTFTPGSVGSFQASLAIPNSASSSTAVFLSGTGTGFSLNLENGASASATVTAGQTVTYNLQLVEGGFNGSISLGCSGAPVAATCTVLPALATGTTNTSNSEVVTPVTITVTTTARGGLVGGGRRPAGPSSSLPADAAALIGMVGMAILMLRRQQRVALAFATMMLVGVALLGCGGGSSSTNGGGSGTGTPAGASTLTVTATSGGVTRTMALTLTVN